MSASITNEKLVQLLKSVEEVQSMNAKENNDFLDNFRQLLNEASPDEVVLNNADSPENHDYNGEDITNDFSTPLKPSLNASSFVSQVQIEKDPVEVRSQLISLVRETPELYDKNDPRYKNNAHKGVLWSTIAREIGNGATGKKVREQWSYMRRKYEEEYHSRLLGNPPTAVDSTKRHLFTYEQLDFLQPYVSTSNVAGNTRSESPAERLPLSHQNSAGHSPNGQQSRDSNDSVCPALAVNLNDLLLQFAKAQRTIIGDVGPTNRKMNTLKPSTENRLQTTKKRRLAAENDNSSLLHVKQDSLPSPNVDSQAEITALNASVLCLSRCLEEILPKSDDDDCTIFGRQIANDLRQLSKRRRLSVRKQIADLLVQELSEDTNGENEENGLMADSKP